MMNVLISWAEEYPPDWAQWEDVIRRRLKRFVGMEARVTMVRAGDGWTVAEAHCEESGLGGTRPGGRNMKVVPHLVRALAEAGLPVIGNVRTYTPCDGCGAELCLVADGSGAAMVLCRNALCANSTTGFRLSMTEHVPPPVRVVVQLSDDGSHIQLTPEPGHLLPSPEAIPLDDGKGWSSVYERMVGRMRHYGESRLRIEHFNVVNRLPRGFAALQDLAERLDQAGYNVEVVPASTVVAA